LAHDRIVMRARRRVAPSLEPGEHEHAVLRGWIGMDRRLFVVLAVGGIAVVALWAFPRSSAPALGDVHAWYAREMHRLMLRWIGYAAVVAAESFAIAYWSPTRWLVLTDRRLLIFNASFSGASPRALVSAEQLSELGMDAVRPLFPAQGNFGLRRPDGHTMHVGFLRSWRPAVDRIAAALHRDPAVPARPDVLTA
jgi:hypothetical protein